MALTLAHNFDDTTSFCVRCGCSRIQWVEAGNGCTGADNVVGISHLLAYRRLAPFTAAVEEHLAAAFGKVAANSPGWPSDGPEAA